MIKINQQLLKTKNVQTIDRYLRISLNEEIAIKYLEQLSLQTQCHLLRKGSTNLQNIIILQQQNAALKVKEMVYQNQSFGQIAKYLVNTILQFGITRHQPQYQVDIIRYISFNGLIKLYNQTRNKIFNDQIKETLLYSIERRVCLQYQISELLKWLYFQDDKTFDQLHPVIINELLHKQNGMLSTKAHKYITLMYDKFAQSQYENVKYFIDFYKQLAIKYIITTKNNTKKRILIKLKMRQIIGLLCECDLYSLEIASQRYHNLQNPKHLNFQLKLDFDQSWLLNEIVQHQIWRYSDKINIIKLVNHILKKTQLENIDFEIISQLKDQVIDSFEPNNIYYHELMEIFQFLLLIKDNQQELLIQLFRIFADRHILFDENEINNLVTIIDQLNIDMSHDELLQEFMNQLKSQSYLDQFKNKINEYL